MNTAMKARSSPEEYISILIRERTGVHLEARHHTMIDSRLRSRINSLGLASLEEYVSYLDEHLEQELEDLVSLLTTHHTFFFREYGHFEFLAAKLPTLVAEVGARDDKTIRVWSAASSRGQEMYSLAMFLDYHLKTFYSHTGVSYSILGTDVDAESVERAKNGVYPRNELKEVPLNFLGDHWARGTGEIENFVKAKKSLKDKLEFRVGNLLEISPTLLSRKFD